MKLAEGIDFLVKHRKQVRNLGLMVLGVLIVVDVLFVDKSEAHTEAEHWPAFWSIFGFVACVVIIFVSKWYGHLGIMQREDYYDDEP